MHFVILYANRPILRPIPVYFGILRNKIKCNFVTQNYWYQFVDLLISSFVPNLFWFREKPGHPDFCTWLAARLSITHLTTCDWSAGDGVIQHQPPSLPGGEEIPSTDNFYNQIKSQFQNIPITRHPREDWRKSPLEDGLRRYGRVRTVKPWLFVIVPSSSSSGHVDSVSAFVNIIRRKTARCAGAEIAKCHQYVKQSIIVTG